MDLKFKVFKKQLKNGLTVLVRPTNIIPRVDVQLWYNVGAKNEELHEKGFAHFIEHMIFKGTTKLSESDINLITQKLSGYGNASTSHDYTNYVFRLPSNVWQEALSIFADCMQNAKFDEEMLKSEIKVVIEEMRLYQDDYQSVLLESMVASAFSNHPYHYPVIGDKNTLCNMTRENLLNFYKKHYRPDNATLVVVGNVKKEDVFEFAEKTLGKIKNSKNAITMPYPNYTNDFTAKTTTLFRDVQNTWCCYAFKVDGTQRGQTYPLDIAAQILANGKSSRLYKKLVNEEKLAAEVYSFMYDFFEHSLLCISVYPQTNADVAMINKIDSIVCNEINELGQKIALDWEFNLAKKRVQFDHAGLLENNEKQAFLIGNYFLATHKENFIEEYINKIQNATKQEVLNAVKKQLNPITMQKGYLLPLPETVKANFIELQKKGEALDTLILKKYNRKTPVEQGQAVNKIATPENVHFKYPKAQEFTLQNGLNVFYSDNQNTPLVSLIINFKTSYLYDPDEKNGLFNFMLRVMQDRTKNRTADELAKIFEINSIALSITPEIIGIKCLKQDLKMALTLLHEIITEPAFDDETVEKIRDQICNEITEFWDSPIDFVDQIARELNYQDHYYSKNPYGTLASIKRITKEDLKQCHQQLISPQQAVMVVVGDMTEIDFKKLTNSIFGTWIGPSIPVLNPPKQTLQKTTTVNHLINRDQIILAFVAPSLSRNDKYFNHLALLDIIITGGSLSPENSRLFQLREESGLFYTINGSLINGARNEPGMMLIKTIITSNKLSLSKKLILKVIDDVGKYGISQEELDASKNQLISASVELFESNMQTASTFLFLKRFNLSLNLFDKIGEILSIIKLADMNVVAKKFCNSKNFSTITVGRKVN